MARGPTHPVTATISDLESRVAAARKVLDGIAVPRLSKCQECLTFHLLRHRSQSLTSALSTLTSSTAQLPPIGHSLQSASSTLQRYTENSQKLEVSGGQTASLSCTCIHRQSLSHVQNCIYALAACVFGPHYMHGISKGLWDINPHMLNSLSSFLPLPRPLSPAPSPAPSPSPSPLSPSLSPFLSFSLFLSLPLSLPLSPSPSPTPSPSSSPSPSLSPSCPHQCSPPTAGSV